MQYPEIPPLVNNDASQKLFSENFSRKPFVFNHNLHCHDLLSIPALQRLADSMSKGGPTARLPDAAGTAPGTPLG